MSTALRPRRGATLIELLVALLLLDLALVSLAAMSAVAARRIGDAGRRSRAVIAATTRLESMRARPCSMAAGGAVQLEPNVFETWTVTGLSRSIEIADSVDMRVRGGDHVSMRTRSSC
jgi:Tfp pilus assembly protein PilV